MKDIDGEIMHVKIERNRMSPEYPNTIPYEIEFLDGTLKGKTLNIDIPKEALEE